MIKLLKPCQHHAAIRPGASMIALILRRTLPEDRFRREHVPGYAEYAQRVKYRLTAGIW